MPLTELLVVALTAWVPLMEGTVPLGKLPRHFPFCQHVFGWSQVSWVFIWSGVPSESLEFQAKCHHVDTDMHNKWTWRESLASNLRHLIQHCSVSVPAETRRWSNKRFTLIHKNFEKDLISADDWRIALERISIGGDLAIRHWWMTQWAISRKKKLLLGKI